jgi:hypothetical protein
MARPVMWWPNGFGSTEVMPFVKRAEVVTDEPAKDAQKPE